ncbi:MAG: TlpA family protein disulfide reductase [Magnetovibrio sp.]|nr:TlpA family protein disulfide reductase [Magnetovibrio sp.]
MRHFVLIALALIVSTLMGGMGYYVSQSSGNVPLEPLGPNATFAEAADRLDGFSLLTNMPAIPAVQMFDEAGHVVTFDEFKGKVVVFNLWATWCPPCIREMPDLNALQEEFANQGLVVVPVASGKQGKVKPADFLRERNLNALTTYYDPGSQFMRTFDIDTLPSTFVLDRNGIMRGGVLGMTDWYSDEARTMVRALLKEGA